MGKYYGKILLGIFRAMRPWQVCLAIASWVLMFNLPNRFSVRRTVIGLAAGAVVWLAWTLIGALVLTLKNYKLYETLDKYGYGLEYLREYEKQRIVNKPFKLMYAVEYASIFSRLGQPADALKYLDKLNVPANNTQADTIFYFYVYVICALEVGNLALAENKWREFQGVIDNAKKSALYSANSYMLYMTLIYIDCYAGICGDISRVQRAYDQTVGYMSTEHYKRYPLPNPDFEIVMLLELKLLGRTEEFNALYPQVKRKIEEWKPLLLVDKQIVRNDLEKVCRGELPL